MICTTPGLNHQSVSSTDNKSRCCALTDGSPARQATNLLLVNSVIATFRMPSLAACTSILRHSPAASPPVIDGDSLSLALNGAFWKATLLNSVGCSHLAPLEHHTARGCWSKPGSLLLLDAIQGRRGYFDAGGWVSDPSTNEQSTTVVGLSSVLIVKP